VESSARRGLVFALLKQGQLLAQKQVLSPPTQLATVRALLATIVISFDR